MKKILLSITYNNNVHVLVNPKDNNILLFLAILSFLFCSNADSGKSSASNYNYKYIEYFESRIHNGYLLSIIERFKDEEESCKEEVDVKRKEERCKEEVDDDNDYDNDGDDTNLDNDDDDGTGFFLPMNI